MCVQVDREEVEALLPKGATELTKQQIRYLLQVSDDVIAHTQNVSTDHNLIGSVWDYLIMTCDSYERQQCMMSSVMSHMTCPHTGCCRDGLCVIIHGITLGLLRFRAAG